MSPPRKSSIVEQRTWYESGYNAKCRENAGAAWYAMPWRRFLVPWRGGMVATPTYPVKR